MPDQDDPDLAESVRRVQTRIEQVVGRIQSLEFKVDATAAEAAEERRRFHGELMRKFQEVIDEATGAKEKWRTEIETRLAALEASRST